MRQTTIPSQRRRYFLSGCISLFILIAASAQAEILVFAAASTASALDQIVIAFSRQGIGVARVSYASSSTLAKQIVNGAPAEVFVSANAGWMDYVNRYGAIEKSSRFDLLSNRLVLITASDRIISARSGIQFPLIETLQDGYLAMGDPDHVPAGMYGKAALESLGFWRSIEDRIARSANARAAVALVERGEAAAGLVYKSDALGRENLQIISTIPPRSHPSVTYPVAIIKGQTGNEALAFVDFLKSDIASRIFSEYGFEVILGQTR
jgi:molybdate transport system substrate-binding protein